MHWLWKDQALEEDSPRLDTLKMTPPHRWCVKKEKESEEGSQCDY